MLKIFKVVASASPIGSQVALREAMEAVDWGR
jgi:hypothetical protein